MGLPKRVVHERQDGGYGWFIVLACFISNFCVLGTCRSLGILYIELLERFNESAVKTAALSAIFNMIRMFFAPVVSLFCKRFSCRLSMFLGSIILCSGFVLSAFVTNLWYLNFTYGLLSGIGASMLFTPPYIMLNQYFDKKKGIAMSLGTLGAGAGCAAIPPLIVFLMMEYSYFGGMIVLGAFQLHNCISGSLFRPFSTSKSNQTETQKEADKEKYPAVTEMKKLEEFSSKLSLSHADGLNSVIEPDEVPTSRKKDRLYNESREHKDSVCSNKDSVKKEQTDILIKHENKDISNGHNSSVQQTKKSFLRQLKNTLKNQALIFKDGTMVLYLCTIAVMPLSHGMAMWFTADAARIVGVSDTNAALLLSYFGVADVIGRISWGPIFDIPFVRPRRRLVHALLGVVVGAVVICHGFASSYAGFVCLICTFGLFEGGYHSQRMAVVTEIVDKSMLEESVGITIFFQGLGNFLGPMTAGFSKDTFGNYRLAYVIGGGTQVLLCMLFVVDYILKNKEKKSLSVS